MRQVLLLIMDGFGEREEKEANAVKLARTPNLDLLKRGYPWRKINASEKYVGLPTHQMGNSEVGHLNIGCGRVVEQSLVKTYKLIHDDALKDDPALNHFIEAVAADRGRIHLCGLLSDGGVHSHIDHLFGFLDAIGKIISLRPELSSLLSVEAQPATSNQQRATGIFIHAFLDGRDTDPACAEKYIKALEKRLEEYPFGKIATVSGRYYAMDRDNRWERIRKAYDAMTLGEGLQAPSGAEALRALYERGETDEFVIPTVVCSVDGMPVAKIEDGDGLFFFNFRPDRARQLTKAMMFDEFDGFERKKRVNIHYLSLTRYEDDFPWHAIIEKDHPEDSTLPELLSAKGMKVYKVTETEKYPHVTFFFNGGQEAPFETEERLLIPSPKVPTYDLQPEMSVFPVTANLLERLRDDSISLFVTNFANGDMVGHTGKIPATIKAVEAMDQCIGDLYALCKERNITMIVTADHGNCELMAEEDGTPYTAHTTNPVQFIVVSPDIRELSPVQDGALRDVAPTLLKLLGLDIPPLMTGRPLIS